MNTTYQVLKALPAYGPMYISITESGEAFHSEGYVVRFSDGIESWVANFLPGITDLFHIHEFDNRHVLVIAGGTAFMIDPNYQKAKQIFGGGYKQIIHYLDDQLILTSVEGIDIYNKEGRMWQSPPISYDGLVEIKLEGHLVSGKSFYPQVDKDEWVDFSLNIETKELTGGSYPQKKKSTKATTPAREKKPWWKFW